MMSFVDVLLLIIALPVILSIIGVLMALREETETYERADYIRLNRSPSQKKSRCRQNQSRTTEPLCLR